MIIYNKSNIITNKDIYKDDERIGEIKQLDIDKINYDKIVTNTINLVNDSSNKIMNIYNLIGESQQHILKNKITFIIKTFNRPLALLNCLQSIRRLSTDVQILVSDDSNDISKKSNKIYAYKYRSRYIELPYNSGRCRCRNVMVENVNTDYFFLLDDDNYINRMEEVIKSILFLDNYKDYHLIGSIIIDRCFHGNIMNQGYYTGLFNIINDNYVEIIDNTKKIENDYLDNIYETDVTLISFIGRTNTLKEIKWDENIVQEGYEEHIDYFIKLYNNKVKICVNYNNFIGEINDNRRRYTSKTKTLKKKYIVKFKTNNMEKYYN